VVAGSNPAIPTNLITIYVIKRLISQLLFYVSETFQLKLI
jgi:hypothetical protein